MTTPSLPQTETMQLTVAPAFPQCPAEVDPNSSLAELREIRAYWIALATELGDFDALTAVVREFGTAFVVPFRNEPAILLKLDSLFVVYREGGAGFDRAINDFARFEYLSVTTGDPRREWYAGQVLARRRYRTNGDYHDENALFIPGAWMEAIRDLHPRAEANAIARYQNAIENKRRQLLAEMGVEVAS